MKKIRFSTIILMLAVLPAITSQAQTAKELVFTENIHDFGLINEVDGPVDHEFIFTNTGSTPIKILNVKASCGCTTPGWTREEVPAGGTGFIKALYNTRNRPGQFNKSLTVTTSGSTSNYVLYIKGNVNPKPRTIEDDFPVVMGGLRAKSRALYMGKLLNNSPVTRTFEIYNSSEEPIAFLDSMVVPDNVQIKINPKKIDTKTKGIISVTYNVSLNNDLGYINSNVLLLTDEKENYRKSFMFSANVEEYFPPLTEEELALAPRLVFDKPLQDIGKIKQGVVITTDFIFKNEGKSELNIRKTESNCSCAVAILEKKDISPGEEGKITLRFDSKGRRGTQQKSITLFSNDPKAPTQRVIIKTYIE